MWISVMSDIGRDVVNLDHVSNFYINDTNTILVIDGKEHVIVPGDITSEIIKAIKSSGITIKPIGG